MSQYADDLAFALELAEAADAITLKRFEAMDLEVSEKPDMTPVTEADLECEKQLRAKIEEARPSDAVIGEEYGGEVSFSGRQWVIDPIDGTKNYVRGVPVWATLICLLNDGMPVVGVVSAPALARRWWASEGAGAWRSFNGDSPRKLAVSKVGELDHSSFSFSSLHGWAERDKRAHLVTLTDDVWRTRAYGDFFSYAMVAEGAVDIAAEPEVSVWDLAALSVLVTEAGGRFSSIAGEDGPHGGDAVATNGLLHDEVLRRLSQSL